ncbi:MAG: glutathione S-transferase N-terminal domain-containing protein [Bdellovibrionota bacterium]
MSQKPKELVLYAFDACPFCQKVFRKITSLGIESTIVRKDTRIHPEYARELIALNGTTQVPCLVIDGVPMLESDDINDYLDRTFG